MIDPLGPDPTDLAKPFRQPTDIVPGGEAPGAWSPLGPKVRHADYDSPAALARATSLRSLPDPATMALAPTTPQKATKFERAMGVARTVLPLLGKMLPLLEGNVVSAASNLLSNHTRQEVNLRPLEEAIARLQADHRALTFHTSEQKRALHSLEDEFNELKEAVQRNAADQAELIEGVARLAKRTSSFMRLVVILLVASILFTALVCVRIAYIIRF